MILNEEIYFEISFTGEKSELKKMVKFLKSGELEDFFEITSDYISYHDEFEDKGESEESEFIFTNDDLGIEVDEFDTDEFLEILCKAGRKLDISGQIYDINDEEYSFSSPKGDSDFTDGKGDLKFNDELDAAAEEEEADESDSDI